MRMIQKRCAHCGGHRPEPANGELRRIREAAHFSLRWMALYLDISPSYLSDIETGRRRAPEYVVRAYSARALEEKIRCAGS